MTRRNSPYRGSNIILIGMPGSGKTTVGRRLAKELGMSFVDTDRLLEQYARLNIQEIVDVRGLTYFRHAEEATLCSLQCTNSVIATGGSVVYSAKAMHHLGELGTRVYLRISLATMLRRIRANSMRGLAKLASSPMQNLYQERRNLYPAFADVTIDNNHGMTDLFIERLIDQLHDVASES